MKKNKIEMVDIVDKDDNVVGQMARDEAVAKVLRSRAVHVMLVNDEDTMLVQWRKWDRKVSPRTYTASAAGAVMAGETYEEAAARELWEELGVKAKLKRMGAFSVTKPHKKYNCELWAGVYNGEPKEAKWQEEADAIDWWNREEAEYMMKRFPYLLGDTFMASLKLFLKLTK